MKVMITIQLGNVAMLTGSDVAVAVAQAVSGHHHELHHGDGGPIRDENGNRVGSWEVEAGDEHAHVSARWLGEMGREERSN